MIKGKDNASAVGTLVGRTSRVVVLVKLPHPKPASALNALQAFTDKLLGIPGPMRRSMTYGQGREMSMHAKLTENTGVAVYFCDPHSPWQRGSNENENMNGLLRQYMPKGTDISVYSQEELDAIANETNFRPRIWSCPFRPDTLLFCQRRCYGCLPAYGQGTQTVERHGFEQPFIRK